MQLKSVKTAADLPFKGVELIKTDSTITEVIIGGRLHIKAGQYTGIQVLARTPGEEVDRWRLTATLDGFAPTIQHFEHEFQADGAADDFKSRGAETSVEKVRVIVDELGEIAANAPSRAEAATAELEDLPF